MLHKIKMDDKEYIIDADDLECISDFLDILKIYESDKKYENYLINIKKTFTIVKAYHAGPNQDITQDRLDKFLSQFVAWVSSGLIMTIRLNEPLIKRTNDFGKYLLKIFEKLQNKNLDEHSLDVITLLEYYFKNKDKRDEIVALSRLGSIRDLAAKRKRESDARSQLGKGITGTFPAVSQGEKSQEKKQKTEDKKINQEPNWFISFEEVFQDLSEKITSDPEKLQKVILDIKQGSIKIKEWAKVLIDLIPEEIASDPDKLQKVILHIKQNIKKINELTKDLIDVVPIIAGNQLGKALANPDLPIFMIMVMGKKSDSHFTLHIKGETAQAGRSIKVEVINSGYKIGKEIFIDLESLLKHLELPLKKGPKPA